MKELGVIIGNSNNKTYETLNTTNVNDKHTRFLIIVGCVQMKKTKCLPYIYWLPKLDKNPTKARFIIAAPKSFPKLLSKSVTALLKMFFHQTESYNDHARLYTSINSFKTILKSQPVIKPIDNINRPTTASSISSFNLPILYTDVLRNNLRYCAN